MTQSSIQSPVTMQELLVSRLAQTDALAKLLIEKGLITREEFMEKISEELPVRLSRKLTRRASGCSRLVSVHRKAAPSGRVPVSNVTTATMW